MLRFGKIKAAKEEFYGANKPIKILDVDVDNIVISKVFETKNNQVFDWYLDEVIGPLVLIMSEMSRYVKNLIRVEIRTKIIN